MEEYRIGDALEFKSKDVSGHGVYIGKGEWVQITGKSTKYASDVFEQIRIVREQLSLARNRGMVKLAEPCHNPPDDPETIRKRALSKVGQTGFNIDMKCGNFFANWCRQGGNPSFQAFVR